MAKQPRKSKQRVLQVPRVGKFAKLPHYGLGMGASDPKSVAVCVPYSRARPEPVHNDEVHVRRTKTADGKYEDTLRVVKMKGKQVRLVCQEPIPEGYKDRSIAYPSARRTETVEIRGLVVGRYTATNVRYDRIGE